MPVNFKTYLQESMGTDQMIQTAHELEQTFRWTRILGYYDAENPDEDLWDSRYIVFVGERDFQIIHNGLLSLGYEYVKADEADGGHEGFIKDMTDLIFEKSTAVLPNGAVVDGYDIGIYAEQMDVFEPHIGHGMAAMDPEAGEA